MDESLEAFIQQIQEDVQKLKNDEITLIPYTELMEEIDKWLEEQNNEN